MSPLEFQWALTYSISPIFLTNGIAGGVIGGTAPVLYFLQAAGFPGLGFPGPDIDIDNYFATFVPLSGSDLINNEFGTYPFANQQTAANAVITQPLTISMMMIAPARGFGGYFMKSSVMTALQATLNQHNLSGGTYTIVTPAKTWSDCLLARLRDMTGFESKQVQWRWQWDFIQPLVSLAQAQAAQNSLIQGLSNGQQQTPNANGQLTSSTGQQQPTVPGAASGASVPAVPSTDNSQVPFGQPASTVPDPGTLPPNSLGNPTTSPSDSFLF